MKVGWRVGCGSIGRRDIRNLQQVASADLMAYDPSLEAPEALRGESRVPVPTPLKQVWERQHELLTSEVGQRRLITQMYMDGIRFLLDCVEQWQPTFNPLDVAAETLRVALDARAL